MKTKHGANIFTDDNRWKFVQIYELVFAPSSTLLAPNIFNLFWHHLCFSMLNYRTETTMKGISNIQWNYSAHLNFYLKNFFFFFSSMPVFGLIGKCIAALCHKLGQVSQTGLRSIRNYLSIFSTNIAVIDKQSFITKMFKVLEKLLSSQTCECWNVWKQVFVKMEKKLENK